MEFRCCKKFATPNRLSRTGDLPGVYKVGIDIIEKENFTVKEKAWENQALKNCYPFSPSGTAGNFLTQS
jgi:hypothetical protein